MSFNYTKARATAKKIISKFGQPSSIVQKGTTGGFDEGGNAEADSPDITIDGIITPLVQYKTNEIDGESIIVGDAWAFFYTESTVDIAIDMQVTINSKTFSVKAVKKLSSVDDINIYTRLQFRK
jgi:hypothetical protein